jgi:hypothetical protein
LLFATHSHLGLGGNSERRIYPVSEKRQIRETLNLLKGTRCGAKAQGRRAERAKSPCPQAVDLTEAGAGARHPD